MKKIILLLSAVLCFATSEAQDYLGLSTGNYSGIQGVLLQPANVADNRYKFEINLVSTNIGFQNNYLGFSRDYFLKNRFSFKDFDSYNDFKNNVLTENAVTGNNVQFNLSNRLNLPSVLITTGKKSGIAIGLQSRTALAVRDLNPAFAKQMYENFQNGATYNQPYNLSGLDMNALNWFEGSFTYGRVLYDNGKHFLKAGVTAKYLGGISSWYLNVDDMNLTVNNDSTISTNGSSVAYGHSPTDFSGQILNDYQPDASGLGFDAGIVYEYRGRINKFKFLKVDEGDRKVYTTTRRDKNKYSFKVGVSLIDAGQLTFKSTPLARDFSSNINGINIKNIGIENVQDLDTFISQNVTYLSNQTGQEFSVAMPTALSAQLDLHLVRGFYVNAMAYMPMEQLNKNVDYRVFTPNYYAVTPRWESRAAGVYVPVVYNNNYNNAREVSVGSTVRLGPLFVGTNNLLTLFQKDDIQSANVHVGFKIPVAHGKPSKTSRWLKKFTNETIGTDTENKKDAAPEQNNNDERVPSKQNKEEEEDVEQPKPAPIQIIINNYNTAGAKKTQRVVDVDPTTGQRTERTIIVDENIDTGSETESDYQDLRNMKEQIEYLKYKLKQKEDLIDEIENQQNQINEGSSTEESKKKIEALRGAYLYDNTFDFKGVDWDTSSSFFDKKAKLFELKKELVNLENKNDALNNKIVAIDLKADTQNTKMIDTIKSKKTIELQAVLDDLREKEPLAIQPEKVHYIGMNTNEEKSVRKTKEPIQKIQRQSARYSTTETISESETEEMRTAPPSIEVVRYRDSINNVKRAELIKLQKEMSGLQEKIEAVNEREKLLANQKLAENNRLKNEEIERLKDEIETLRLANQKTEIDSENQPAKAIVVQNNDAQNKEMERLRNEIEALRVANQQALNKVQNQKQPDQKVVAVSTTAETNSLRRVVDSLQDALRNLNANSNARVTSLKSNEQEYNESTTEKTEVAEVKALENEIESLQAQLDKYKKKVEKKSKRPKRVWKRFNSNDTGVALEKANRSKNNETVQIVRDTVFVDRVREKIVQEVIRDTVTNVVEKNNVVTETKVERVTIDNTLEELLSRPAYYVLFGVGSTDIQTVYKQELNFYARQVRSYPVLKLRLTGHADATGNAASNLLLSKNRAQQVRNYLIQRGVPKENISIDFSGEAKPLETNQTRVGKSQNRRVEILFER